jgi:hypothetical protein
MVWMGFVGNYFIRMAKIRKATFAKKWLFFNIFCAGYFLFNQSFTKSGAMIASVNVYAPVLGDLTILIALVKRFEPVCNDATAFFAMTYLILFLYERSSF